jgi:catechol 2,3-dioxygenase-like lactoylglutathione lyase family enzyme
LIRLKYSLEVVVLPVADAERSLRFYRDKLGFVVDVDYKPTTEFRVIQLTPPGSACSVQLGVGQTEATPGSARRLQLVVEDVEQARAELAERGVVVGEVRHKFPFDTWAGGMAPGLDEHRRDYASFVEFADPDGNTWSLQERGYPASAT